MSRHQRFHPPVEPEEVEEVEERAGCVGSEYQFEELELEDLLDEEPIDPKE